MWRVRYYKDYIVSATAYLWNSLSHKSVMPSLIPMEDISQLSPCVIRVLGQNPGPFTLQGTNTYLVGTGESCVLIDTGEPNLPKFIEVLREALKGRTISHIICTHWHEDHVGGLDDVIKHLCPNQVPVYKMKNPDESKHRDCFSYLEDGQSVEVEGASLRFVSTPGHTSDHTSLWLEEEAALFSGDCILGSGTTIFENLSDYMNSLQRIKDLNPRRIYPGHGPVVEDTEAKVNEYISHRMVREQEILGYFQEVKEASSMDVVKQIYKEAPFSIRIGALGNVRQHLKKLVKDGRLREKESEYFEVVG